jgi:hypothetical protein
MMIRVRCGEQGRSPIELVGDWLAGRRAPSCSEGQDRKITFTRSGREAIALAMRRWKVGPGDEVLVPAYNCGSDVSPMVATGARVMMYRVDGKAEIDIDDIRRRLSEHQSRLVTHLWSPRLFRRRPRRHSVPSRIARRRSAPGSADRGTPPFSVYKK